MTNINMDDFLRRKPGATDRLMRRGVGIDQRYWVEPGEATSDLAVRALNEAMERARIEASQIKALYLATSSPDMPGVSTAAIVQDKAKLLNSIFASNNADACPGFIFALHRAYADLTSPLGVKGYSAVIGALVLLLDQTVASQMSWELLQEEVSCRQVK